MAMDKTWYRGPIPFQLKYCTSCNMHKPVQITNRHIIKIENNKYYYFTCTKDSNSFHTQLQHTLKQYSDYLIIFVCWVALQSVTTTVLVITVAVNMLVMWHNPKILFHKVMKLFTQRVLGDIYVHFKTENTSFLSLLR